MIYIGTLEGVSSLWNLKLPTSSNKSFLLFYCNWVVSARYFVFQQLFTITNYQVAIKLPYTNFWVYPI